MIRNPQPNRPNVTGRTRDWKAAINTLAEFYGDRITHIHKGNRQPPITNQPQDLKAITRESDRCRAQVLHVYWPFPTPCQLPPIPAKVTDTNPGSEDPVPP